MYKFTLYYDPQAKYQDRVKIIIAILGEMQEKWKVDFNTVNSETLPQHQLEKIKNSIRSIPPQIRGKIVSARNKILPLSKSKNLNTTNTPVLILYHDEKPIDIYPHMLGASYFEIEPQLERILENGIEAHMTAKGLLEEPIQKILSDDPSFLEKGMRFRDANKDVGFGIADVILEDAEGRAVIVEIETKATETAVAQVARLAAGYASKSGLSAGQVRKVILCQQLDEKTVKACQGANIELYKLTAEKIC